MRHITPQCMGEHDFGPFWPFPGTYPGLQGSKNGYFYGKNQTNMAGLHQARLSYLESVQCALTHPNAGESMTLGHFGPFQAPVQGPRGSKMAISTAKTRPKWQDCSRLNHPTWILSSGPYHTPRHVKAGLRAIFTLGNKHIPLSRAGGVQK